MNISLISISFSYPCGVHRAFTHTFQRHYLTLNYLGLKAPDGGMNHHYQHFMYKEAQAEWGNLLKVTALISKVSGRWERKLLSGEHCAQQTTLPPKMHAWEALTAIFNNLHQALQKSSKFHLFDSKH